MQKYAREKNVIIESIKLIYEKLKLSVKNYLMLMTRFKKKNYGDNEILMICYIKKCKLQIWFTILNNWTKIKEIYLTVLNFNTNLYLLKKISRSSYL